MTSGLRIEQTPWRKKPENKLKSWISLRCGLQYQKKRPLRQAFFWILLSTLEKPSAGFQMAARRTKAGSTQPGDMASGRGYQTMLKYSLRRLFQSLITVFLVVTLVFLLMRLLPVEGYFADGYDKLTPEQREAILRKFGLLDPWYIQLRNFYVSLSKGNLGHSIIYRPNVAYIRNSQTQDSIFVCFRHSCYGFVTSHGACHGNPHGPREKAGLGQNLVRLRCIH